MTTAAIVPAAGRGERLGPGAPKALRLLAGEPLLVHAVRALAASVDLVVVAVPAGEEPAVGAALGPGLAPYGTGLMVVAGGATRQESVHAALAVLPPEVDVVLVHDAARPLAPRSLVDSVVEAVREGVDAVVPGLPLADTVKEVDRAGWVCATPDRARLRAVQTPQGFRRSVLVEAHAAAARAGGEATDDAALVEALGRTVRVVPGHEEAFKITRSLDLLLAEAVVARRRG